MQAADWIWESNTKLRILFLTLCSPHFQPLSRFLVSWPRTLLLPGASKLLTRSSHSNRNEKTHPRLVHSSGVVMWPLNFWCASWMPTETREITCSRIVCNSTLLSCFLTFGKESLGFTVTFDETNVHLTEKGSVVPPAPSPQPLPNISFYCDFRF